MKFSWLQKLFDGSRRDLRFERDSSVPWEVGMPARPNPSFFAYFLIWTEAERRPGGRWAFGHDEVRALLRKQYPEIPDDYFVWERLVESICAHCGIKTPHSPSLSYDGRASIWSDGNGLEGQFHVEAGWKRVEMTVTTVLCGLPDPK